MTADLLTATITVLAAVGVGAVLEYVCHAVHIGHHNHHRKG